MRNTEGFGLTPEDEYFNDVLESPPVLPVGDIPIVHFVEPPETIDDVATYAWHGTRDLVVDVRRTRRDTSGPVVGVELCSSTPIATAHSTAREFDHCGIHARRIEHDLMTTEGVERLRDEDQRFLPLVKALARQQDGRALVVSALQRTLFELTPSQSGSIDTLRERLRHNLAKQRCVYEKDVTEDDDGIEARWGLRYRGRETEQDYLHILTRLQVPTASAIYAREQLAGGRRDKIAALRHVAKATKPGGEELAQAYIDWQAGTIARLVANNPNFRPARFLSMDVLDPDIIAAKSVMNTQQSTKSMHLFPRAVVSLYNRKQHIRGDIRKELPVPDDSLTFIVSFDGWRPIEHRRFRWPGQLAREANEAVVVLQGLYNKLKPGGQLIIFPWTEENTSRRERRALDKVKTELGRLIHHGVDTRVFHPDTVEAWMTEGDRALALFQSSQSHRRTDHTFESLTVTKLHESMVSRPSRNAARAAGRASLASQPRIQD